MKFIPSIILVLCCSGTSVGLLAQTDSVPPLASLLRTLTPDQETKVLDYAHHLGVYGRTLEAASKKLDEKNQQKVARYIGVLTRKGAPEPTTVHWNFDTLAYGQIEEGTILLDSFTVTNTGTAPYIITGAKGSCDCTVVHYPEFPVMPGDKGVVRIEFDSVGKGGNATPGFVIYDNSRPNRRNILFLDGFVVPRKAIKVIRN